MQVSVVQAAVTFVSYSKPSSGKREAYSECQDVERTEGSSSV